ncbi:PAS domain S-box protein [Anabaena azotica]|uniref:PAS domain S-box protein n=1 Tax=Anabaena azotica TaxID=197653 RepID=UPI0039A40111
MAIYHYSVILIEDSPEERSQYCRYFSEDRFATYEIFEAKSASEALTYLASNSPDLIVLDYQLPDMDTLEFLYQLQLLSSGYQIPVIMLGEKTDEAIAVEAMKNGVQDYIVKSKLTCTGFHRAIHTVLEKNRLIRRIRMQEQQKHLLAGILLHIRQFWRLDEILTTAVQEVQEFLQADRVIIYQMDSNMNGKIVAESILSQWTICSNLEIKDIFFPEKQEITHHYSKIRAISDIYNAELTASHIHLLEQFQVKAHLVVPILLNQEARGQVTKYSQPEAKDPNLEKEVWGLLIAHQCSTTREWEINELDLLQQLSVQLALAIQQAELYENLQTLNTSLEQKVQKRTNELQASERRFRAIFDNSFQFTGLLTTAGIVLEANQTALTFAGLQLEEVVNKPFWETSWWKISQSTQDNLRQAIARAAQGEFIRYEVDILGAGNQIATIDFSIRPLKDELGQVIMLIPEGRNISDKKRIERQHQEVLKALQASEAELRGLFNAMVDVILVTDREGRYLKIAPTKADKLYQPAEELLGKTAHEVLPAHLADQFVRVIGQTLDTQQASELEYSLQIGNQKVWFSAKVSPISQASVIWAARDITAAKRNAIIRQQAEKAFEENQILLQVVMDSLPMAIFWKDRNYRYLGCNRQLVLDAGKSSAVEILGKTDFDMPWKEQAPLYRADDCIVMESGQPKFNIEEPFTKSGNIQRWLRTNKIPLQNSDGEIIGVLSSYEDITERKEIEQALQESERRYATLATSAPVGIYRTDAQGNCLYVNDYWCQIAGLTPQAAAGCGWQRALHSEDQELIAAEWDHLVQTGKTFSLEYRFQGPDRVETWVFGQAVPEIDSEGTVTGYVGTITNITGRKQTEEALRRSQQLYRTLVDNFPNGAVVLFDHNLRYLLVGGLGLSSVGLSQAEMEGKTIWEIFPAEVSKVIAPLLQQSLAGKSVIAEIAYEEHLYMSHNIPVRDDQGNVIGGILMTQDITERKQTEQERDRLLLILEEQNQTLEAQVAQRTAELQQSKERFRNLVETSSDWVWEVNEFGFYTYCSPQIINLLGYSPEEIVGKTPFDLMPPEEAERVRSEFMKFVSVQAPFQCLENINCHKDGRLITLETSAVPIFDTDKQFRGYRGMDRDITVRQLSEAALRQSEARFQRIATNVPGVMYQYILHPDDSYEFVYISDRSRELFEIEPATIQQNANVIFDLIHPEDLPSLHESITRSANSLQQWSWEGRLITPSGRQKWIEGVSQPEQQANGDILWDGLILDISEQQIALRERKQIEVALRNLSDRLDLAIKSAQIGIWDWDIVNDYLVWDDQMYALYGINSWDFKGAYQAWETSLHPEDHLSTHAAIQQAIAGDKDFKPEFRIVWPDGTIKFIKAHALLQRDEQGKALRMIGINFDITERKQSEAKLQEAEIQLRNLSDRLKLAVKSAKIGIWDLDLINDSLFWDERMYELFGVSRASFDPSYGAIEKFENLLHPDDRVPVRETFQQAIAEDKELDTEFRTILPNGTIRIIKAFGLLQRNSQGQPHRMIGINYDISDRKQAEAEILHSRDLREAIFNESADALFLVDAETLKTIDCNQRAVEMFAATNKSNLIGIEGHELQKEQFSPEQMQAITEDMEQHGFWSREIEYKTFQGKSFWGNLAAKQITVAGQKMNLVRVTDISQRKLAETQLQQTNKQLAAFNEELARATRLKDEFLATMSHELRTPLNAILGMSEGMQDQIFGTINEKQRRGLQTIERSGQHLLELINDILDLSKIEAGQMELHYTSTAIKPLCQSSLAFIKQQAFQKRIQLEVRIQPHLPDLMLDERRIRQVLINLLNNAVKFTPEGGQITLDVTCQRIASEAEMTSFRDCIRIAVIDTGIGIAPENIKKLFQPFIQIDSALNRQYAGTGLGLSLVKRLVETHGGKVGVSSELGVGSCFTVDLPCGNLSSCSLESGNQASADFNSCPIEAAEYSPLILLAEDNEGNIFTISNYLEAIGYRIILAKNGQEAIALTKTQVPNLILMDIQMPGVDGLEAIKQIRSQSSYSQTDLPIIALTALAMPGDREKCLEAGANDYLTKPITLKHLANIIKELLTAAKFS